MWELDENVLCQSPVYINALHLATIYNESGKKAPQTEENQSKFNINTANTLVDAVARSCLLSHRANISEWLTK